MLDTLWQDLRHGTRMLVKAPGYALVAILSIALGVGANAAMFLRGLLPSQGGIDFTTYLFVVPALAAVTLLAAYIPGHRAARIDPLLALRQE